MSAFRGNHLCQHVTQGVAIEWFHEAGLETMALEFPHHVVIAVTAHDDGPNIRIERMKHASRGLAAHFALHREVENYGIEAPSFVLRFGVEVDGSASIGRQLTVIPD